MLAKLCIRSGPQRGALFPLLHGRATLIGRSPANQIVLPEPEISGIHCLLAPGTAAGRFALIDARSRSGLLVNGKPFTKGTITFGDVLTAGSFELELVPAGQEAAAARPTTRVALGPCLFEFGRAGQRTGLPLQVGVAIVVGRGNCADVRLDDGRVSEYHCILTLEGAPDDVIPLVIDLYSSNHTYVDGLPTHRKHLVLGHIITVGKTRFEIRRASPPEASTPSSEPSASAAPTHPDARGPAASAAAPPPPARMAPPQEADAAAPADIGSITQLDIEGVQAAAHAQPALESTPPPYGTRIFGVTTGSTEIAEAKGPGDSRFNPSPALSEPSVPSVDRASSAPASAVPNHPDAREAAASAAVPPPPAPVAPPQEPGAVAPADLETLTEINIADHPAASHAPPALESTPPPYATEACGATASSTKITEGKQDYWTGFGLAERPFGDTLDPRTFYPSRCHGEAFVALTRWVQNGPPLALLYGEKGSGKTFLASCLTQRLAQMDPRPLLIRPTKRAEKDDDLILAAVVGALEWSGQPSASGRPSLDVWHALLAEIRRRQPLLAFLIDDAHEFAPNHLQQLGELLENQGTRGVVRVLLIGEERLREVVSRPPFSNPLGVSCCLTPIDAPEVAGYVVHRLSVASSNGKSLFTARAAQLVATYSGGIPRRINQVADAALAYAARCRHSQVTHDVVSQAIQELLRAEPAPDDRAEKPVLS